jgi:hypothetical protein
MDEWSRRGFLVALALIVAAMVLAAHIVIQDGWSSLDPEYVEDQR